MEGRTVVVVSGPVLDVGAVALVELVVHQQTLACRQDNKGTVN
jgi:hypothetical protein